jgi:DNA-binding response OmpR family regulator
VARRLRALRPGLPVVFMSGYFDVAEAPGLERELLRKPFSPAELLARVRATIAA